MSRALRLWNGRSLGFPLSAHAHAYVAAYSVADARRVCVEAGFRDPGYHEIKTYWSECWGTPMEGVTPERGLWVSERLAGPPVRWPPLKNI